MSYIVIDIDKTIADHSHRDHLFPTENLDDPRAYDDFMERCSVDEPIDDMLELIELINVGCDNKEWGTTPEIVFLTSRCEKFANTTMKWFDKHSINWDQLITREDEDTSSAVDFKRKTLKQLHDVGPVICVIDDDEAICKMARELGIVSLQVRAV